MTKKTGALVTLFGAIISNPKKDEAGNGLWALEVNEQSVLQPDAPEVAMVTVKFGLTQHALNALSKAGSDALAVLQADDV